MVGAVFAVSLVWLFLVVVHVYATDTGTGIVYRYCKPWKFVSTDNGECRRCSGCRRGQYHDNSTLVPLDEKRGALQCPICRPCPEGYYSDQHTRSHDNIRYCRRDRNCAKKNRLYKKKPKLRRKSECGPCLDGYVEEWNWDDDDGVCEIETTTSTQDVSKVTDSEVKRLAYPEDYIAPIKKKIHESVQETKYNIGSLEKTVKREAKKNRDHHQLLITISLVSAFIVTALLIIFGYKFRKKCDCFNFSTNEDGTESPLGSSKTPLMVDGGPSQQSSPQQSAVHIGMPKVTILQDGFCGTQGSSVVLQAKVTGAHVQSVVWKRIQGGLTPDVVVDDQKYARSTIADPSLLISHLALEDDGAYQCTATNDIGTGESTICRLEVTENPDLVLTPEEICRAKHIQLQPLDDKLIQCVANYAKGDELESHMMENLYSRLKVPAHKATQIRQENESKGVRECVLETLNYYVKRDGRNATAFSLYQALTDWQYLYELEYFVKIFRDQFSDEKERDADIPMTENGTKHCADDNQQGSNVNSGVEMPNEQTIVEGEVKLEMEGVSFTNLEH